MVTAVLGVVLLIVLWAGAALAVILTIASNPLVAGSVDAILAFPVDPAAELDEDTRALEQLLAIPARIPPHEIGEWR